ncbi:hypothetical protein KVT40_000984 [Elsinoe batatas]|uniref:Uncharacterized protein n=1 Tax=Elsinoe batatas TaxID=2601811 RepID=A0A8K0PN67_9PEZI|nr:hypothetical protein KVT40_000984 [Elsinoe batatas]
MAPVLSKILDTNSPNPPSGFDYNRAGFYLGIGTFLALLVPGYLINAQGCDTSICTREEFVIILKATLTDLRNGMAPLSQVERAVNCGWTIERFESEVESIDGTLRWIKALPKSLRVVMWPAWDSSLERRTKDVYKSMKLQLGSMRTIKTIMAIENAVDAIEIRLRNLHNISDTLETLNWNDQSLRMHLVDLKVMLDNLKHQASLPVESVTSPTPTIGSRSTRSDTLIASEAPFVLPTLQEIEEDTPVPGTLNVDDEASGQIYRDDDDDTLNQDVPSRSGTPLLSIRHRKPSTIDGAANVATSAAPQGCPVQQKLDADTLQDQQLFGIGAQMSDLGPAFTAGPSDLHRI